MNIRPTQSVPTLGQRRALDHYLALQRQADRERRIAAEQHTAALIERSKQPAQFAAPDDTPVSPWSIRAEFGRMWPTWALAFLGMCIAGGALTVLYFVAQKAVHP